MSSDLPLILYDCGFDENVVKFDMKRFKIQSVDSFCIWHQLWRLIILLVMLKNILEEIYGWVCW